MEHTTMPMRLGLWRVTRHERVRALYDRLADRGVVLAQLDRFERETTGPDDPESDPPDCVRFRVERPAGAVPSSLDDAPLAPGDRIVLARQDDERVGHCVLSDRPVFVPELARLLRVDGAYCWRLYVRPSARGCGIGTAIVARALAAARTAFDSDLLQALVAPDNLPSRRTFGRLGFDPVERFTTVGAYGLRLDRRRPLAPPSG